MFASQMAYIQLIQYTWPTAPGLDSRSFHYSPSSLSSSSPLLVILVILSPCHPLPLFFLFVLIPSSPLPPLLLYPSPVALFPCFFPSSSDLPFPPPRPLRPSPRPFPLLALLSFSPRLLLPPPLFSASYLVLRRSPCPSLSFSASPSIALSRRDREGNRRVELRECGWWPYLSSM